MAKASNLVLRFATAAVGVPAILALIYLAPPWAFYLLCLPSAVVGASELFGMTHEKDRFARVCGALLAAAASLAVFFFHSDARVMITALIAIPFIGLFVTLVRPHPIETAALRAFSLATGPVFIAVPLTLLGVMRHTSGSVGAGFVLYSLGFAWFSDTGAYFAGRFLGKHKLYPEISPNKTIEGALGGLAGAVAWSLVGAFWFLRGHIPAWHAVVLAIVGGGLGQVGDLCESLIKRSTGKKDSGHIVPGHGGILDRVDALILTATTVYLYTLWFHPKP
jgi:phosphatidate cytidylyltransferase